MNLNNYLKKNIFFLSKIQAEARAEFAERSVQKLQKEVDRLEGMFKFNSFSSIKLIKC